MQNKKGFTLLELLVVVLIIGILAGIALPQYNKAVEKAKVTEALLNIKTIEGSMQRYILKNGFTDRFIVLEELLDIDLSGGEFSNEGYNYVTKNFKFNSFCDNSMCVVYAQRTGNSENYVIAVTTYSNNISHECYTFETDMGRYICKYLNSQGWDYVDEEY